MTNKPDALFAPYGRYHTVSQINNDASIPFKDHPQFGHLLDIFNRRNNHHVIVQSDFPPRIQPLFLKAFLLYLETTEITHSFNTHHLLFLNFPPALEQENKQFIEKEFCALNESQTTTSELLLIAIGCEFNKSRDLLFWQQQLWTLAQQSTYRLIIFVNASDDRFFARNRLFDHLSLQTLSQADLIAVLKQERCELEDYHHAIIPDEVLPQAFAFAKRYLSSTDTISSAIELIDSCAARIKTKSDPSLALFKPTVTSTVMCQVLSEWTQIPTSHLSSQLFRLNAFQQGMQQRVFGQDYALTLIEKTLQRKTASLQAHTGPAANFLFVGPIHAGKRTTALALAEYLFQHVNAFYSAKIDSSANIPLLSVTFMRDSNRQCLALKDILRETPFAILFFDEAEQLPAHLLTSLQEILLTGYLHDENGNRHSFSQTVIILNTSLGSHRLQLLPGLIQENDTHHTDDLMQIVAREQKNETIVHHPYNTPQECVQAILPDIASCFPKSILNHVDIVPFFSLTKPSIEKILHLKLRMLTKQLHMNFNIEFGYAPEVIPYLTRLALTKERSSLEAVNMDKALDPIYRCLEHALLEQADNKNRPTQLFLQLNETGQDLRCDWLALTMMREHSL